MSAHSPQDSSVHASYPRGAGSESKRDSHHLQRFFWTAQHVSDAGLIAFALGLVRQVEHGEVIIESSIELQTRPPRVTDAWRFFHAGRLLARDSIMAATARRMGAYIALGATSWHVIDVNKLEAGATEEHVVTVMHPAGTGRLAAVLSSDDETLRFVLTPEGRTLVLATRGAVSDATGSPGYGGAR